MARIQKRRESKENIIDSEKSSVKEDKPKKKNSVSHKSKLNPSNSAITPAGNVQPAVGHCPDQRKASQRCSSYRSY